MSPAHNALKVAIVTLLELIADSDRQTMLQQSVPYVDVPAELFCKWGDDLYHPETVAFAEAFTACEMEVLNTFNKAFENINCSLPLALPPLDMFMQFDAWRRYRDAARRALDQLARCDSTT